MIDRRTALLLLCTAVGVSLGAVPLNAQTTVVHCSDPRGCPDLTVDPSTMDPCEETRGFEASNCAVVEGLVEAGTRRLLRFSSTTPNQGPGDLILGIPELHSEWFESSECHGHYHLEGYAEYRLWTPSGYAKWDALRKSSPGLTAEAVLAENPELHSELVTGRKQAFCLMDSRRYELRPPKFLVCSFQGISVGWADHYGRSLDGQWVDVTGAPAGTYVLEAEVNPNRFIEETDYTNNRGAILIETSYVRRCS